MTKQRTLLIIAAIALIGGLVAQARNTGDSKQEPAPIATEEGTGSVSGGSSGAGVNPAPAAETSEVAEPSETDDSSSSVRPAPQTGSSSGSTRALDEDSPDTQADNFVPPRRPPLDRDVPMGDLDPSRRPGVPPDDFMEDMEPEDEEGLEEDEWIEDGVNGWVEDPYGNVTEDPEARYYDRQGPPGP